MSRSGAWAVLAALCGLAPSLQAQSVSPPIAEYQERARSSFQLQNPSIFPVTVVLEVRGFNITDLGEVQDVPLDTNRVHVRLSEMSFRIQPRGTRTIFYEATSDSLPTWFNILSAISGTKTESGLNVRILLPHVVYLNQKQPLGKPDVIVRRFEIDPSAQKARIQLENPSPRLGRIQQVTISSEGSASPPSGGFPLLPHRRRWVEVPWTAAALPERLVLRFSRFTLDTVLSPVTASLAADSVGRALRP
jgi:hypothetical protein